VCQSASIPAGGTPGTARHVCGWWPRAKSLVFGTTGARVFRPCAGVPGDGQKIQFLDQPQTTHTRRQRDCGRKNARQANRRMCPILSRCAMTGAQSRDAANLKEINLDPLGRQVQRKDSAAALSSPLYPQHRRTSRCRIDRSLLRQDNHERSQAD
jgi:hypothetical protein